jgi:nucleotide-binding universal stress UspA family protein
MAFKDLLAVVDTAAKDEQFLRDAIAFAAFHGGSLAFVITAAVQVESYGLVAGVPFSYVADYEAAIDAKRARIEALAQAGGVEVRTIVDPLVAISAEATVCARYCDAVLFGPADNYLNPATRRLVAETLLFSSGRPVIVLPNGYRPHNLEHIAIGWNATRESTRALRDATFFAKPGAQIDVLVVDAKPSADGHGAEPGADIARHLARHGFAAEVVAVSRGDRKVADALVLAASERGAGLLALGAYGHSRFREMILGGVTRSLIEGAFVPILFSH